MDVEDQIEVIAEERQSERYHDERQDEPPTHPFEGVVVVLLFSLRREELDVGGHASKFERRLPRPLTNRAALSSRPT